MNNVELSEDSTRVDFESIGFTNDFMFGYVMSDSQRCKDFLSQILDMEIDHIQILESQKTIDMKYDAHSIRLDIYADDGKTVYNCEMQTANKYNIPKRSRYYQSQIDMHLIAKGEKYQHLKKCYIIFICTFDPFGQKQYLYTFENLCHEVSGLPLNDGTIKVIVNSRGEKGNVSDEFKELMDYINNTLDITKAQNPLIRSIDEAVKEARSNEKWRHDYMTFGMKLDERFEEGRETGFEEGRETGFEEGEEKGEEKGLEKGLRAMVFMLKPMLNDLDKVCEQIKQCEDYKDVTREMVKKYYL